MKLLLSIVDLINFKTALYIMGEKRKIAFFTLEKITPLSIITTIFYPSTKVI